MIKIKAGYQRSVFKPRNFQYKLYTYLIILSTSTYFVNADFKGSYSFPKNFHGVTYGEEFGRGKGKEKDFPVIMKPAVYIAKERFRENVERDPPPPGNLFGQDGDDIEIAEQVNIIDAPFIAALKHVHEGFLCHGVYIAREYFLTSASCVKGRKKEKHLLYIVSGINALECTGRKTKILRVHVHKKFNMFNPDYNIAYLRVKEYLPEDFPGLSYITIRKEAPEPNATVYMFGWSKRDDSLLFARNLHNVSLYMLDQEECEDHFTGIYQMTPRLTCARVNTSTNLGDCISGPGAPVVIFDDEIPHLVALAGTGEPIGRCSFYPGLLTLLPGELGKCLPKADEINPKSSEEEFILDNNPES